MNNPKWTWFTLAYQTSYAYIIALMVYQLGTFLSGGGFGLGTLFGFAALALLVYLLVRKPVQADQAAGRSRRTAA
jgi:ferrous iron transport protein B